MLLYAASNLQPENKTFDATKTITFSWNSNLLTQYAYRLKFYDNSNNNLLFDTTQIVSSDTTYTLSANSLTNDKEVKYVLTQWADSTNTVDSEYILFETSIAPTCSFVALPTNTQSFTFQLNVTLDSNTGLQKYRFILTDDSNNIIQDTGDVYGLVPQYKIDGLVSGINYLIEGIVTDQNNQSGTTGKISFTTDYSSSNLISMFNITVLDDEGAIQIDFPKVIQMSGVATGTTSYVTGKFNQALYLSSDSNVEFDLIIPKCFTLTFYKQIPAGFTGDIMSLNDNQLRIFYDGTHYGYQIGGYTTIGNVRTLPPSTEFIKIGLKYGKLIIQTSLYTEILTWGA